MRVITCPECGHHPLSTFAECCPSCRAPLEVLMEMLQQASTKEPKSSSSVTDLSTEKESLLNDEYSDYVALRFTKDYSGDSGESISGLTAEAALDGQRIGQVRMPESLLNIRLYFDVRHALEIRIRDRRGRVVATHCVMIELHPKIYSDGERFRSYSEGEEYEFRFKFVFSGDGSRLLEASCKHGTVYR